MIISDTEYFRRLNHIYECTRNYIDIDNGKRMVGDKYILRVNIIIFLNRLLQETPYDPLP